MFTVIETPTFQKQAGAVWTSHELHEFIAWIAANPDAGDVIAGADGARKVRWSAQGKGKRSGARIIYFNQAEEEIVLLVMMYPKSERSTVKPKEIETRKEKAWTSSVSTSKRSRQR